MSDLYPEVRDIGSLAGVFNLDQFLVVGVEGQKDTAGTAVVGTPYLISDPADADTRFGPASSLGKLVKFMLARGLNFVWAVASASNTLPTLVQRQAAWTVLEENVDVRVRLTDSVVQAELAALADSCEWAEGIQNRQFCVVGMATPSSSAGAITAAGAISSRRGVLVSPGVIDSNGTLLTGVYSAAYVAAEVAKNVDITDDLDTLPIAGTLGIEKDATNGMPLYRLKAGAGVPVNDFNTLLAGGVSPLRQGRDGQAEIVHLRTTYTVDSTFDALLTLLVKDEVFIRIRRALTNPTEGNSFLRRGNTADNRALAAAITDSELRAMPGVQPKILPDGTTGFGVTVTASPDKKRMIVSYQGEVVRNTQKIDINGVLTIAV